MKIALVCPYAWDAPGGVQVHVVDQASVLRARGHEVIVIAPASGPVDGITVVGAPIPVPYRGTVAPIAPWPWQQREVRRALRAFAPEVVHVHEPFLPSTSRWAVRSAGDAAVVATFHAYTEDSNLLERVAPALRGTWRRIDVAIAVSEAAASMVSGPFRPVPVIVPNGIAIEAFANVADPHRVEGRMLLWVNRLDAQKGFPVAVQAFTELATRHEDLTFVVAGDGADRTAVDVIPAPIRARVKMLGRVAHDELPAWFAGADVFISPAVGQESFGIVLVEAMAAGTPVVASDIPGYREVLSAQDLVPPSDAGALASAIERLLADPARAAEASVRGRKAAEAYSWGVVAPRLEELYALAGERARDR